MKYYYSDPFISLWRFAYIYMYNTILYIITSVQQQSSCSICFKHKWERGTRRLRRTYVTERSLHIHPRNPYPKTLTSGNHVSFKPVTIVLFPTSLIDNVCHEQKKKMMRLFNAYTRRNAYACMYRVQ